MPAQKKIFALVGSASGDSANQKLVEYLRVLTHDIFVWTVFNDLKSLPHFDPERSIENTPQVIVDFRKKIEDADGLVICTPEYVFSIPSGLKNAIEWCVSTMIFSEKPTGLITASAQGEKGHEELQLIMNTVMARFTEETTLLIQGIKGKVNALGECTDVKTRSDLMLFVDAFNNLLQSA